MEENKVMVVNKFPNPNEKHAISESKVIEVNLLVKNMIWRNC